MSGMAVFPDVAVLPGALPELAAPLESGASPELLELAVPEELTELPVELPVFAVAPVVLPASPVPVFAVLLPVLPEVAPELPEVAALLELPDVPEPEEAPVPEDPPAPAPAPPPDTAKTGVAATIAAAVAITKIFRIIALHLWMVNNARVHERFQSILFHYLNETTCNGRVIFPDPGR